MDGFRHDHEGGSRHQHHYHIHNWIHKESIKDKRNARYRRRPCSSLPHSGQHAHHLTHYRTYHDDNTSNRPKILGWLHGAGRESHPQVHTSGTQQGGQASSHGKRRRPAAGDRLRRISSPHKQLSSSSRGGHTPFKDPGRGWQGIASASARNISSACAWYGGSASEQETHMWAGGG